MALTFTLLNWSETALIRGEECSVPLTEQQECRKNNWKFFKGKGTAELESE